MLNTSSYKNKLLNKEIDEIDNNPSIVSHLLKNMPEESKPTYVSYKLPEKEKENFKIIHIPSYLNGITILQNFEKSSFN